MLRLFSSRIIGVKVVAKSTTALAMRETRAFGMPMMFIAASSSQRRSLAGNAFDERSHAVEVRMLFRVDSFFLMCRPACGLCAQQEKAVRDHDAKLLEALRKKMGISATVWHH
jgi:hypothetical protein